MQACRYLTLMLASTSWLNGAAVAATHVNAITPTAKPVCKPYGLGDGTRYDPVRFIQKLHSPQSDADRSLGPWLIAHRGVSGRVPTSDGTNIAPENTLAAIDAAAAMKLEAVELDVQMTADGHGPNALILSHDYTSGRMITVEKANDPYDPRNSGINGQWVYHAYRTDEDSEQKKYDALIEHNRIKSDYRVLYDLISGTGENIPINAKNSGYWTKIPRQRLYVRDDNSETPLYYFDNGEPDGRAPWKGQISLLGRWEYGGHMSRVVTLREALQYIGETYPGMTVFIDLRHRADVAAAMEAIRAVNSNCLGLASHEWIVLKPFANVFPGGAANAYSPQPSFSSTAEDSFTAAFGSHAGTHYKVIPVLSNRLVFDGKAGERSIYPSTGPDPIKLTAGSTRYVQDWLLQGPSPALEVNYIPGGGAPSMQAAWQYAHDRVAVMGSWRPVDIRARSSDPTDKLAGFNWKDDGTGFYPVAADRPYSDVRKVLDAIVTEDAAYVLSVEVRHAEKLRGISIPIK
jgi:glycerophosphoryl diester phosphodiesterase